MIHDRSQGTKFISNLLVVVLVVISLHSKSNVDCAFPLSASVQLLLTHLRHLSDGQLSHLLALQRLEIQADRGA